MQAEILSALFTDPSIELSISELAHEARTQVSNAYNEVVRLLAAGLVEDRRVGRSRLIRANQGHELFRPLSEIILKTYGPHRVLSRALEGFEGVEAAYIFGSWAERYSGVPGPAPHDIDVLVVGDPERRRLTRLMSEEAEKIGKEVNVVITSPEEWRERASGFMKTVAGSALINLVAEEIQ